MTFFNKIEPATSGNLSDITEDSSQTILQSFYVFEANTISTNDPYSQSGGCGEGCDTPTTTEHMVYLLESEGAQQQINHHDAAMEITDWLRGLKIEAGL